MPNREGEPGAKAMRAIEPDRIWYMLSPDGGSLIIWTETGAEHYRSMGLEVRGPFALAAAPREDEGLREALKSLADWVEYGLDLSDEYSLEGVADGLVNCRRSVRVWVDGQERLDMARARLAASPVASRTDDNE